MYRKPASGKRDWAFELERASVSSSAKTIADARLAGVFVISLYGPDLRLSESLR